MLESIGYSDLGVVDEFCNGATPDRTNLSDGIVAKVAHTSNVD